MNQHSSGPRAIATATTEAVRDGQVPDDAREPIGQVCAECGWILPVADKADSSDGLLVPTDGAHPDHEAARGPCEDVRGRRRQRLGAAACQLAVLWAGLVIGVSFLATPAKFLAPSLPLAAALDVGRQTFFVLNRTELVLGAILAVLGSVRAPSFRPLAWAVPGSLALLQAGWLLPLLDARVQQVLDGGTPPESLLHAVYVGIEVAKLGTLLALGLAARRAIDARPDRARPAPAPRARSAS